VLLQGHRAILFFQWSRHGFFNWLSIFMFPNYDFHLAITLLLKGVLF